MICTRPTILIALMSLAAEGTPRMAIALCREWMSQGMRPVVVVLNAAPDDLAIDFADLGIECVVLDIPKAGYRRYALLIAKFFQIARRYRPEALLSMPLGWHAFMAIGVRLAGARRVVAHVGNYPNRAHVIAFAKFRLLVQLGRPFTDCIVCCSRYVEAGAIKNFGVGHRETAVVYNGAQAREFPPREAALSIPISNGKPFKIGMVARLERHKDQATLIRAAQILKERGLSIHVEIIGEGSQRNTLQMQIEAGNLGDTVSLLGMRRDVANVLTRLDLFVFSTTPDEGFGIALVEAMLAGVPILASDVGACREVLEDGTLGALFPAGDAIALADAVEVIAARPQEAQNRAQHARAKALRDFSVEAMARGYAEALGLPNAHRLQIAQSAAPGLPA